MRTKVLILAGAVALALVLSASPAAAIWVSVFSENGPQDPLFLPNMVDELGIGLASSPLGLFPPDEEIAEFGITTTDYTPCSEPGNQDSPLIPNIEVRMTNLTTTDFAEVWYVADEDTGLTNFDGWVNGGLAFKIDSVGFNTPLVGESMLLDDVFEAGESWSFVIQDYTSGWGGPASAFLSIGVGIFSPAGPESTGSIVAIPVPEPGTMMMLFSTGLMGLVAFARRRKRA